jgi:Flp pilus assembly protein TadB
VARCGTLRASDADRDQIIDRLRKASAEGRLAVRELEHRVATALRARTFAELDATVSDLPGSRLDERRSVPRRAIRAVYAHPALLLVAIPVALAAVATLVAIAVLWSTLMLVVFLLGHRHRRCRGPWTYTAQHRFGRAHGAHGGRGSWL